MILRIIVLLLILGIIYYIYKIFINPSEFKQCEKCDGKGYWLAVRGERDKCDVCGGAGKVPRQQ